MSFLKKFLLTGLLIITLMIIGCGARKDSAYHIREDVDFSFIEKVAVLPLDNLSNDRTAGEAVRQVVINELLVSGLVDVVVPGDAISAVDKTGIRSISSLNAEQIKNLGKTLKVQAVVFGSVERFGTVRIGNVSAPEVTITLMMADANSGSIIWSVTRTSVGDSFMARHFGSRVDTLSETMLRVVREAIQTLTYYY